jgi:hypothetical protein
VIAGAIGRGYKQKEEVDLVAIEAVEIDALDAHPHRANQLFDAGVLGVRHGNTPANAGAAQLFALHDGGDDAIDIGGVHRAGGRERGDKLPNNRWLFVGGQIGADRRNADKIAEFHGSCSSASAQMQWLTRAGNAAGYRSGGLFFGRYWRFQVLVAGGAMLFEPLLEPAELIFHFIDHAIHGGQHGVGLLRGHELVVVLGRDAEFDARAVAMLQIDCDLNRCYSIEELPDGLHLFGDLFLRCGAQMTVPGRYSDLHAASSQSCWASG